MNYLYGSFNYSKPFHNTDRHSPFHTHIHTLMEQPLGAICASVSCPGGSNHQPSKWSRTHSTFWATAAPKTVHWAPESLWAPVHWTNCTYDTDASDLIHAIAVKIFSLDQTQWTSEPTDRPYNPYIHNVAKNTQKKIKIKEKTINGMLKQSLQCSRTTLI